CVIVCPERAIIAGDLDDPASPIAVTVAREPVQVRKAEQGTRPKVFYVGADAASLTPELQMPSEGYLWAERPREEVDLMKMVAAGAACARWLVAGATGRSDLLHLALVPSMLLALATAGYSAFLFGQAEGRDFWQSPLVLPHLIVGAVLAGAAALSIAAAAAPLPHPQADPSATLWPLPVSSLVAHGFLIGPEVFQRHPVHD